jgi:hypothetical protein
MATQCIRYTFKDIENVIFNGFQYNLQESVVQIIQKLEQELSVSAEPTVKVTHMRKTNDASSYDKHRHTNDKKRNDYSNKTSKTGGKELTNTDWDALRNFKATKMETKEGVDKSINDIRILLNKITNKNYETQKDLIITSIKKFMDNCSDSDTKTEDISKLSKVIFDIASTNKFFSEIYANLYKELISIFHVFADILNDYIVQFKNTIDHIYYVNPDVDYNAYCSYIKINDNRKATSMFIVNMCKNGTLDSNKIIEILDYFVNKSLEYILLENKANEIEEITENIYLIVTNSMSFLEKNSAWEDTIMPNIIRISQMKLKEHPSLTNRILFKYMDIIDSIDI